MLTCGASAFEADFPISVRNADQCFAHWQVVVEVPTLGRPVSVRLPLTWSMQPSYAFPATAWNGAQGERGDLVRLRLVRPSSFPVWNANCPPAGAACVDEPRSPIGYAPTMPTT
jgi:hypothetical protein